MFIPDRKVQTFACGTDLDPELELQGATLSVKMCRVLMDELTYKISGATFWTDSQTTL